MMPLAELWDYLPPLLPSASAFPQMSSHASVQPASFKLADADFHSIKVHWMHDTQNTCTPKFKFNLLIVML